MQRITERIVKKNILVPLDVNSTQEHQKIIATLLDDYSSSEVCLHLVSVLPFDEGLGVLSQFIPAGFEEGEKRSAKTKLEKIAEQLSTGFSQFQYHLPSGNVYVEILALSERLNVDLIVLGSHKPELKDYLLGPSAARVMRHAKCSVLIVR